MEEDMATGKYTEEQLAEIVLDLSGVANSEHI
jgi:hypothetical protein